MNFTFTWILDKFGFVPKFEKSNIDLQEWPFPAKKETVKKPAAKKVAKKSVKIPKATTRKPKTK
jgi:hypothetical protein